MIGVAIHGLYNDPTGLRIFFNSPALEYPQRALSSNGLFTMLLLTVVFIILYKEGPNLALRKGEKGMAHLE